MLSSGDFKDTPLGPLPADWSLHRLIEVTEIITDFSANGSFADLRENVSYHDEEDYAILLRLTDFTKGFKGPFRYVDKHAYDFLAKSSIQPGDLIISNVGSVGTIFRAPNLNKPMTLGPNALLIKGNDLNDFLFFWFQSPIGKDSVIKITSKTAQPKFNKTDFRNLLVSLPPIPEQRAIAHVLSTVRQAIESTEQVIAAARELKRSLMKYLFTYGTVPIDRADQVPLKQTEIGDVPEEWEVSNIGDMTSEVGSGATPRGGEKVYLRAGIPLIRSQNVLMNKLSLDDVAYISDETHKSMSHSYVRPGDVLLNITGASIGRVASVPEWVRIANVNQHVCRIRPITSIVTPEFLEYYLSSEQGQENIWGKQYGTTRQGLNFAQVRSILTPIPIISEQRKIAVILISIDNKIEVEAHNLSTLKALFTSLLHHLMTGKVRIGVNHGE